MCSMMYLDGESPAVLDRKPMLSNQKTMNVRDAK